MPLLTNPKVKNETAGTDNYTSIITSTYRPIIESDIAEHILLAGDSLTLSLWILGKNFDTSEKGQPCRFLSHNFQWLRSLLMFKEVNSTPAD